MESLLGEQVEQVRLHHIAYIPALSCKSADRADDGYQYGAGTALHATVQVVQDVPFHPQYREAAERCKAGDEVFFPGCHSLCAASDNLLHPFIHHLRQGSS